MMATATSNLRKHLIKVHAEVYDDAVLKYGWKYPLSTMAGPTEGSNDRNLRNPDIPHYSPEVFLDALVRLIVADDQSIRVIECPEFRYLCMVLRENLVDTEIPRRDKMREAILGHFQKSFEELKLELAVSLSAFRPHSN
jgi:hypothetical protein